ncbi:MAG: DUF5053 domain-containing protein [Mangrovibacterium sp.]
MDLQKSLNEWVEEWVSLDTDEEKKVFDVEFRKFIESIPDDKKEQFSKIFMDSAISATNEARDLVEVVTVRQKLEPVLEYITISQIAKNYFKKSRQWLYMRLNGTLVNGKPAKFTDQELKILSHALKEISERILRVSQSIG